MSKYHLDYLGELESEAIHIMREVAGQFERPALLFSGGKDSITLVHLALKAFRPGKFPFPLVHIDTGHNFPEALHFRDKLVDQIGEKLIVRKVEDTIKEKNLTEQKGKFASRNALQTYTLLDIIDEFKFDALIGGARRDEEKARAKERIFSVRDEFGQWNPKLQRPELWDTYNGKIHKGENVRAFPISNWTELDVWNYIRSENIDLPSIYFAHERDVLEHEGQLVAVSEFIQLDPTDVVVKKKVRYRTVGDMTCTAAVESNATALDDIINATTTEQYIKELPADRKEPIIKFRNTILQNLPKGFKEVMSYGMLGYVVPHEIYPAGYHCNPKLPLPFINLGSQKNFIAFHHMGIYSNPELLKWFTTEYPNYTTAKLDMGKGCIRFKNPELIPYKLIGELVKKVSVKDWIATYEKNFKK